MEKGFEIADSWRGNGGSGGLIKFWRAIVCRSLAGKKVKIFLGE